MTTLIKNKASVSKNILKNNVVDFKQANKITDLCLSHQQNKKWILLIDSDEKARDVISADNNIDKSKILHINSDKVRLSANNIETALSTGNCSAVVLLENNLQQEQLSHLNKCAQASNTTFMVLDKVS